MELDYDGDTNDSRQYCRHGTFVGSWWGPDYLCGWCESGDEPEPPLPSSTVSVFWDGGPYGDRRYHLDVTIGEEEYELGDFPNSDEAGKAMLKWLTDRGLTTALGSGARIAHAVEINAALVVLDVVRRDD